MRTLFFWLASVLLASAGELSVRPGFSVERIAGTPLVDHPLAVEWDAHGRLAVLESGGVLKVFTEREKFTVFADGLGGASAIFPWRAGWLVATANSVEMLGDENADGRADKRTTVVPRGAVSLEWGMDGWIYCGAKSGSDFRFSPDTGKCEEVHGVSANGRRRDDWGNWYGNGDGKWLWHYSFDPAYLRAGLEERLVTTLGNYGDAGNVYPGKKQMPVAGIGVFSAYRDDLFGTDFATSVFICERAARILHREVLAQDGISFLSRRAHDEQRSEFLEGGAFVSVKTAPDGTLAVVDSEQGIYRVFPSDKKPRLVPDLASMRDGELADALHSPGGWQRDTVERLLIEREAKGATGAIRRIVRLGKIPQARLQSLATLDALHTLEPDDVRAALRDRHYAPIRTQAVRFAEEFSGDAALLEDLSPFTEDPDMCVRRQLALSVRRWSGPRVLQILTTLAYKIPGQPDLRAAVLGSLSENDPLAREIRGGIKPPPPPPKFTSDERAKIAGEFAITGALKGDGARGLAVFKKHCSDCHRSGEVGASVGPQIPQGKPLDRMLMAILDPGASVDARYLENKIKLKDGSAHTGIVVGETKDGVKLRLAGGGEETLRRDEMTSQQAPGKSLMPDDFSTKLKPQDIADILAWLGR